MNILLTIIIIFFILLFLVAILGIISCAIISSKCTKWEEEDMEENDYISVITTK